ncbi:ABC transporter ATP-binding protein [Vampirovibrio sp.]|uniref:ABC transporter ATP-binding protein n=1 Tax=Vampirovibrio sp. TaxID=2717857 RepID=UPI003593AB8D
MIRTQNIQKSYVIGEERVKVLHGVDLEIQPGEMVALTGSSGSGKSTLMNILGCLDKPDEGAYFLAGEDVAQLSEDELAVIRNQRIGFVFQTFNLLPRMSALENVGLPLMYAGETNPQAKAREALTTVGLASRVDHEPNQLSGGQRQRVAIARAIINNPAIILADEPTGNLDSQTGLEVMDLFTELNRQGRTIIIVTHEPEIAAYCHRQIKMKDGRLLEDNRLLENVQPAGNGPL